MVSKRSTLSGSLNWSQLRKQDPLLPAERMLIFEESRFVEFWAVRCSSIVCMTSLRELNLVSASSSCSLMSLSISICIWFEKGFFAGCYEVCRFRTAFILFGGRDDFPEKELARGLTDFILKWTVINA